MDESSKAWGKRFTPVNKKKKKIWRKERKILGSRLWTRLCVEKNMENERYGWKLSGGRGRTTRSTRENRRIDRWPLKGSSRIREEIVKTLLRSCVSPYDSWKQETASGEELQKPCRKRSRLTSYSPAGRAISSIDPFRGEETCAYTTPTPASPALNVALTVSPPPPSSSSGHPSLAMASKHGRETYSSRRRLQLSIQTYSSLHQFPPSFAEERKDWRRATSPFPLEFSFEYSRMNFLRKVYICNRVHRISYYIWLLFMKTGQTVFSIDDKKDFNFSRNFLFIPDNFCFIFFLSNCDFLLLCIPLVRSSRNSSCSWPRNLRRKWSRLLILQPPFVELKGFEACWC